MANFTLLTQSEEFEGRETLIGLDLEVGKAKFPCHFQLPIAAARSHRPHIVLNVHLVSPHTPLISLLTQTQPQAHLTLSIKSTEC
jgi:hypothetical protein